MTGGEDKRTVLVLATSSLFYRVKEQLNDKFFLHKADSVEKAVSFLRRESVACIVAEVNENGNYPPLNLSLFTGQYPTIPLIAVVEDSDFELMSSCAEMGAKEIVTIRELNRLKEKLLFLTVEQNCGGAKHWIDTTKCSPLIKKAVGFSEDNYCRIIGVQDIADHLGVKIQTLSSEFSRQCNASLKGFLVFLKVRHAIFLMNNPAFKIKDIAKLTGFSDLHHFRVCFKRLTGMAPHVFRNTKMKPDLQKIFEEKVKKTHLP